MTIRTRILIPMIGLSILVAVILLVSSILQFSRFIDYTLDDELHKMVSIISSDIDMMKSKAHIASQFLSNDPVIRGAMERNDRGSLLSRAAELFEEADVELFLIANASGRVLARPHDPEIYGDDISFMQSALVPLSGQPFTTVEYGLGRDIIAASGAPTYNDQGRLLGVTIVGSLINSDTFVDQQKIITNCEIMVYREDLCIGTTLLNDDGTRAVNTIAPEHISQKVLAGETYQGRVKVLNKDMLAVYAPIKDTNGKAIGILFVGHNLNEKTRSIWSFLIAGFTITAFFLGLCTLIAFFVVRHVSKPIITMLDKVHYDELTGIFNRRFFNENIHRLIKSLSRSNGTLSLMMIDIDYFKKYNDTYGHNMGDICLKTVANALSQCLTRADDFAARYGGEEFLIVLPNTNETGARGIANKLLENVRDLDIPHEKSRVAKCVTISIGVTSGIVNHLQTGEDYIQKADEMLYESKRNGRNKYTFSSL